MLSVRSPVLSPQTSLLLPAQADPSPYVAESRDSADSQSQEVKRLVACALTMPWLLPPITCVVFCPGLLTAAQDSSANEWRYGGNGAYDSSR
jgi:hypothetical protein